MGFSAAPIGIATENGTCEITEEANLSGMDLGREEYGIVYKQLLRVLDAKLGSLNVPGENGGLCDEE